jgi:uncharacterized integral membrane protein
MIRKILKSIVMIPAAALLVALAIANRQPVTVSFDPFDPSDSDLAIAVPLYLVGFAVLIAGVILGGVAAWLKQGKWRRTGTRLAAEIDVIRTELEQLKRQTVEPPGRSSTHPAGSAGMIPTVKSSTIGFQGVAGAARRSSRN